MTAPVTVNTAPSSSEGVPTVPGTIPGRRLLVLILLMVNTAATVGQAGWFFEHVSSKFGLMLEVAWGVAIVLGGALELVGAFLAQMADALEARRMPAGGIRAGSYLIGLLIGALNFSHWWAYGWQASAALGFFSTISPFLWGIYARVRRGTLTAPSRRMWHPIRSVSLLRLMAWEGIASEEEGVMALEMSRMTSDDPAPTSGGTGRSMAEIGREAIRLRTETPGRSWESIARDLRITDRHLRDCRKAAEATEAGQ